MLVKVAEYVNPSFSTVYVFIHVFVPKSHSVIFTLNSRPFIVFLEDSFVLQASLYLSGIFAFLVPASIFALSNTPTVIESITGGPPEPIESNDGIIETITPASITFSIPWKPFGIVTSMPNFAFTYLPVVIFGIPDMPGGICALAETDVTKMTERITAMVR